MITLATLILLLGTASSTWAYHIPYNGGQHLIGQSYFVVAQENIPHFRKLPARYNIGYDQFLLANPALKNNPQIRKGQIIYLPKQSLLPKAIPSNTIVVNIAEKRLYYYHTSEATLYIYPVGIGRSHTPTPLGHMRIIQKRYKPVWNVTADGLKEARENGYLDHPRRVPPGPDNPLGDYAIHLSKPHYLIHSTNDPEKIGTQNTAGCVNLYPEHMAELFPLINLKTKVEIINQPIKTLNIGHRQWREQHPLPKDSTQNIDTTSSVTDKKSSDDKLFTDHDQHLLVSVNEAHGIPELLSQPLYDRIG